MCIYIVLYIYILYILYLLYIAMLNYQRVSSIPGARTLRPKAIGGRAAGSAETSQVRRFFPAHETSRALAIWRFPKMGGTPKMDGL